MSNMLAKDIRELLARLDIPYEEGRKTSLEDYMGHKITQPAKPVLSLVLYSTQTALEFNRRFAAPYFKTISIRCEVQPLERLPKKVVPALIDQLLDDPQAHQRLRRLLAEQLTTPFEEATFTEVWQALRKIYHTTDNLTFIWVNSEHLIVAKHPHQRLREIVRHQI